jgi:hypothetical protein
VLGRNKPRNFCATRPQKQRNFTATNEPKKLRQLHSMDTYSCFKLHELRDAAGDDWADIKDSPALLTAFASALRDNAMRSIGELPDHYIKLVQCLHCGPVKLWESCPDVVLGCPWCLTKRKINEQYV